MPVFVRERSAEICCHALLRTHTSSLALPKRPHGLQSLPFFGGVNEGNVFENRTRFFVWCKLKAENASWHQMKTSVFIRSWCKGGKCPSISFQSHYSELNPPIQSDSTGSWTHHSSKQYSLITTAREVVILLSVSRFTKKLLQQLQWNCVEGLGHYPRKHPLHVGWDLDKRADPGYFFCGGVIALDFTKVFAIQVTF